MSLPTITPVPVYLPGQEVRQVTTAGLTVYWVTFGLMAFSALCFFGLSLFKPVEDRSHGYVTCLIVTTASCAYYAMASWGGNSPIGITDSTTVYRSIYWARYVDWFVTTPLLLLDLMLVSAIPFGDFLWIAACDIFMILTGLFGATSSHRFKWGFFGAGCLFQVLLTLGMIHPGIKFARRRSPRIALLYTGLTGYLLTLWWGYPIVWGLAEGSNTITVDAEVAAYAGLDIATKVIFGWAVMLCYPVFTRQSKDEYSRGIGLPSLLSSPTNALLSPAHASSSAEHTSKYTNPTAGSPATPTRDNVPTGGTLDGTTTTNNGTTAV